MFETKHLALATSYPPPSSIHPTGCLLPRGPLIPTPADGGVCPVPECSRRAGPAVGPNQLLISCSEGLFVVLPPPQGPGQLRSGHGCPPPPAKVWVRWVSSHCQSPLPPPSCPSCLRESRAWVAHREQGGSRGGAQGPPTAMDINHGPTLSTVPPICQGPSLRTEPRQGHSTARAGACPTSSLCCPLPG